MNYQKQYLGFILEDQNTKQIERFDLLVDRRFIFEAQNHFTGIEWWNKIGNFPYPIRYHVEISQLMYGLSETSLDPESMIYEPYNVLCQLMKDLVNNVIQYHFPISCLKTVVYAIMLNQVIAKLV
jgi:hypothetical protein